MGKKKDNRVFIELIKKKNEYHNAKPKRNRTRKRIRDEEIKSYEESLDK